MVAGCIVRASEGTLRASTHSVKYSFSYAPDCVSRMETERIYLDCSAFAMLFLRANHASAIVLHMPLPNHGISFNIVL